MSSEWLIEGRLQGGRLIQVTNTGSLWAKNLDFENRRLTRAWRLNTGPLHTGSTVPKMHCWPNLSCKLEGTARFHGKASKYPKTHCWSRLSCKLEGTARFYGKSSKYPRMHCWPYISWKLEGTARFYGRASKYPKMHYWPSLSCKLEGTARFYGKSSKYPKKHCWPYALFTLSFMETGRNGPISGQSI